MELENTQAASGGSSAKGRKPVVRQTKLSAARAHNSSRASSESSESASESVPTRRARLSQASARVAERQAAWPRETRLADMEQLAAQAQSQLQNARKRVRSGPQGSRSASAEHSQVVPLEPTQEFGEREQEMARILKRNVELQSTIEDQRRGHLAEVDEWASKYRRLEVEQEDAQVRITRLQDLGDEHLATIARREAELEQSNVRIRGLERGIAERDLGLSTAQRTIEQQEAQLAEFRHHVQLLEAQAHEHEKLRKKLHNTIQELKGNIRVFCRVRGGAVEEQDGVSPYQFPDVMDKNVIEVYAPGRDSATGRAGRAQQTEFTFDRVFGPAATQAEVFEEISQLVQSSLDGYNTCIFAYGQTGSGKTYTMEGAPDSAQELRGMIPRTVEQIFETAATMSARGWQYSMQASFLEIYNEKIRDLLNPPLSDKGASLPYEIKHDHNHGSTTVSNLTVVPVGNGAQVRELLMEAARNRAVGSTKANDRSSRSHSVFTLQICGRNAQTGETVSGLLNLVDLAGSERLAHSEATGDRLTETKHINKSLSALGDVIYALGARAAHVPYRNSTLTNFLTHSLGGNSKTLMFVNISPNPRDLSESLSSLRFAAKVNSVEIGTARKQPAASASNPTLSSSSHPRRSTVPQPTN